MPHSAVQLWLPDSPSHFQALLEQARDVARCAHTEPGYTASIDQALAQLGQYMARTGVNVRAPGVGEGFLLGVLMALGATEANAGRDPRWVAGGVMAYAIRAVEGPIPPKVGE